MSKAKLAAARELIGERDYETARALLLTISDDPTAARWMAKLDEIDPIIVPIGEHQESEEEAYYREENRSRRRRRRFAGLDILLMGVGLLGLFVLFYLLPTRAGMPLVLDLLGTTLLVMGVGLVLFGLRRMMKPG